MFISCILYIIYCRYSCILNYIDVKCNNYLSNVPSYYFFLVLITQIAKLHYNNIKIVLF